MRSSSSADLSIEALRGFAALLVVFTHYAHFVMGHAGWLGVASTGVDLFFVLSGFVFAPYLRDRTWDVAPYLLRRLFRLYPLYVVALAVYVALKLPSPEAWRHLGVHLSMLHTTQSVEIAFFYNPAFWSLPPEVEFYLVLPLLARLVGRFGLHAVFWPALVLRLLLAWHDGNVWADASLQKIATVHLPGLLVEFLLGAWAWRVLHAGAAGASTAASRARWLIAAALLLALTTVLFGAVATSAPATPLQAWAGGLIGGLAALGYAALVASLAAAPSFWQNRPRASTAASWAGHLSYGVYLLHNAAPPLLGRLWPALGGPAAAAACLALTLAAAWLAHVTVERPMRAWGRRLSRRLAASRSRSGGPSRS